MPGDHADEEDDKAAITQKEERRMKRKLDKAKEKDNGIIDLTID